MLLRGLLPNQQDMLNLHELLQAMFVRTRTMNLLVSNLGRKNEELV